MEWLTPFLQRRSDLSYQTLDLRDFDRPFFDERASNPHASLVAEYTHAPTAPKNALDCADPERPRRPGTCVRYGGVGGARAVEGLRSILVEVQMAPVRPARTTVIRTRIEPLTGPLGPSGCG